MRRVSTIGEILVEVMRPDVNVPLSEPGQFVGPYPSGAPAIFIDALARLGVPTGIIGCVGDDDFGRCVVDRLRRDGVDVSQVQVIANKTTAVAFVTYFDSGDRRFIFHLPDAAAGQLSPAHLDNAYLDTVDVLHVNGSSLSINENTRAACVEAVRRVKQAGGIVTLDPNVRTELLTSDEATRLFNPILPFCDYVLPSAGEAEAITGHNDRDTAVSSLLELGVRAVVCKHGEHGSALYMRGDQVAAPAFPVDVVDPTGAGDCFSAGFVYGLLQRWDWLATLRFANAMGALATRKRGPMEGCESLERVTAFMKQMGLSGDKPS